MKDGSGGEGARPAEQPAAQYHLSIASTLSLPFFRVCNWDQGVRAARLSTHSPATSYQPTHWLTLFRTAALAASNLITIAGADEGSTLLSDRASARMLRSQDQPDTSAFNAHQDYVPEQKFSPKYWLATANSRLGKPAKG